MNFHTNVPEKGYYYHYKHDPEGEVNNYAYEVVGVGVHTEEDCRPEDSSMVVYRPLYNAKVFEEEKFYYLRPLEMFMENVTKEGKTFPRFRKISDKKVIAELEEVKRNMYGDTTQGLSRRAII